jgi:hypothetical protein
MSDFKRPTPPGISSTTIANPVIQQMLTQSTGVGKFKKKSNQVISFSLSDMQKGQPLMMVGRCFLALDSRYLCFLVPNAKDFISFSLIRLSHTQKGSLSSSNISFCAAIPFQNLSQRDISLSAISTHNLSAAEEYAHFPRLSGMYLQAAERI